MELNQDHEHVLLEMNVRDHRPSQLVAMKATVSVTK